MTIEEGNEIITEFIGSATDCFWSYDSDWNELMYVIEHIEKIRDDHHGYFAVNVVGNTCTIQGTNFWKYIKDSDYGTVYMSDTNATFLSKIESTWYVVVQFIQWYKNVKK